MVDPISIYGTIKWLAPILGAGGFALKMRQDVLKRADDWANKLLNNHLHHIQEATTETVAETKKTNALLASAALNDIAVARQAAELQNIVVAHQNKTETVWAGVLNTLTVLEDRTARQSRTPRRRTSKRTAKRRK